MSKQASTTVQLPFLTILGLIFITLKLTGYIAWSWLWVLSPFWLPLAVVVIIVFVGYLLTKVK